MDAGRRTALDEQIRRHVDGGDIAQATTVALRGYGPEVLRFLVAISKNEQTAADAFSLFSEGVWRHIGRFDWGSPVRAWLFGVARRASLRLRRDAGRRAGRELALEAVPAIAEIAAQVRDRTLSFLRTEVKDRFARLRDTLAPEDRALLILRVDQELSWNDCALALADGDDLAGPELARASARLRKRFQVLKDELLELGRREGLVSRD